MFDLSLPRLKVTDNQAVKTNLYCEYGWRLEISMPLPIKWIRTQKRGESAKIPTKKNNNRKDTTPQKHLGNPRT